MPLNPCTPPAAGRAPATVPVSSTETAPSACSLSTTIEAVVEYAERCGLIASQDRVWAYNAVLEAIGATGPGPDSPPRGANEDGGAAPSATFGAAPKAATPVAPAAPTAPAAPAAAPFDLEAALARLAEAAVENGAAADTASGRDRAAMRVMGALTPRPSEVARRFEELRRAPGQGPKAATDYLYRLSCDAGYVRRAAIARNIRWESPTRWGSLEITINLSKPEKDPRDIAAAAARDGAADAAAGHATAPYPACQLCLQNEGYPGRAAGAAGPAHPARQNLRIVPVELGGERWGLQYSPYAYFDEHCIVMSAEHRPMHIDRAAYACLFDFAEQFPHYFIGSNADLPIVGGSILAHDHFQGGAHEFPLMRARAAQSFRMSAFPQVEAAVLEWPLTVLRLRCTDRAELLEACVHVTYAWRAHTDEAVGVVAVTPDGEPHNTVTPVVRRHGDALEAYLALRCNITSDAHPLGVFHPHAELHHIKKENIGLIEVMGLAILPPRLVNELGAVKRCLLDAAASGGAPGALEREGAALEAALSADPLSSPHAAWARELFERRRGKVSPAAVDAVLRDEVARVFARVLEDAGVFKWDAAGRQALARFLAAL